MSRDLSNHPDRPVVGSIVQLTTQSIPPPRDLFSLAREAEANCPECGGRRHEGPCTAEGSFRCPKCRQTSGDSWSQCGGFCPMVMSPHFATEAAEEYYVSPRNVRAGRTYDRSEYPPMTDAPCKIIDLEGRRP
jgi:hypothetical protein